jgi:hypothetical protein
MYTMVVVPIMIWWRSVKYKTSQANVGKLQRLSCLDITEAIRMAPTAAVMVLIGLPPFHLRIEVEAQVGVYRLNYSRQWKPKTLWHGHTVISQAIMNEPILQVGTDKMIPRYEFHKQFTVNLPDRGKWDRSMVPLRKGDSSGIWLGPRQMKALELRCMVMA